jgi:DNA anti-recombination protein RmuC
MQIMLELLAAFSVEQILVFSIMLILAIKGGVDLFDWAQEQYLKKFNKDYRALSEKESLEQHYEKCRKQQAEFIEKYVALENRIYCLTEDINEKVNSIETQLTQLTKSDMHNIKSWVVEKHHYLTEQGWVDDFTMDTIEKRFEDYQKEKGNSYVEGLVSEIRALPHHLPKNE